ncbi:MAG: dihydroorotate dehydrogenase [Candidatus Omnitrophota bacterium]
MDLKVKIGKTIFKNPVWVASGTFGNGEEYQDFVDLGKVGAVIAKTVTLNAREGNPPPRIVETSSGMLNSIGLENKGIDHFKRELYPFLKKIKTKIIVSIAGYGKEEFTRCAEKLSGKDAPDAIELNLSCPNVAHGGTKGLLIAQDPRMTEKIVSAVRRKTGGVLIAKLAPNVTDIAVIARAAEAGGADAVSLVNTYMGMAVDAEEARPVLGNLVGGLSGPAIKPMALKAVWDVYNSVRLPIIGIGGVMTGLDVAEFMLCGARAVQVGTANFVNPDAQNRILEEFKAYLKRKKIQKASALVGKLQI